MTKKSNFFKISEQNFNNLNIPKKKVKIIIFNNFVIHPNAYIIMKKKIGTLKG